jgi:hypothetical protein
MPPVANSPVHLGIMAKYWQPGRVKTRLGGAIGMDAAAEVHRELCLHLAETLRTAADRRAFVIDPASRRETFAACLPPGWLTELQAEGDLGRRMQAWFDRSLPPRFPERARSLERTRSTAGVPGNADGEDGREDRILIGADCPQVTPTVIDRAATLLQDHAVVLGPATDGGYYLIGLRGGWRSEYECLLREMPWSSEAVLEETRRRADAAGLRVAMLEPRDDIDTKEDLTRVLTRLNESVAGSAERRLADRLQHVLTNTC